jgi:hypothetical protein
MGEYATLTSNNRRESVKIGTCEDMYYLRFDQRHQVAALPASVDPVADAAHLRFRFPWPDEDHNEPGDFDDPFRRLAIPGVEVPAGVGHSTVQFVAQRPGSLMAYVTSLPCPEGSDRIEGLRIHRNGFAGAVHICQQRIWEGRLVTVAECGGCGAKYRLETLEMAEPVLVSLRSVADAHERRGEVAPACRYREIADRIAAGYRLRVGA